MDSFEARIRRFLVDNFALDGSGASLDDEASFLEHGIIDSTGVLELVLFVEETFDLQVEDQEVIPENFDSIARLVAYIARKQPLAELPRGGAGGRG